jgi:DNA-binding transcriptional LysR family regulator
LGLTLFTRSPRGLTPMPAALALEPHVEAMAAAAAALGRAASGEAAADRGAVRVTASDVIGCEVLPPILAAFHAAHPGIAIELALSNRTADLGRRDADIAVRMVRPTQSGLVARRIGASRIGLYAHRDYLARFGEPRSLADLASHCVIGFDRDNSSFRGAGDFARTLTRETFGFRCDNDLAQLAALRAGAGVGGCQENIARRMPELVAVLPSAFHYALEVWLVMHEDLKATRRVRLLFDHLAVGLTDYVKGRA